MSTESKRAWREAELERYAEYKRIRAQARRDRYWDRWEALAAGREPRECLTSDSHYRYEYSTTRFISRLRSRIQEKTDRLEHLQAALPHEEQLRLLAGKDLRSDSGQNRPAAWTRIEESMRKPHWNDYPDADEWARDYDARERAETYGISDITGPDDARRRIDVRFADLDAIEWPGRTKQARENERRLVEAIMLDMYDRGSIYGYPSKRYLSRVSGMATSPVYRVFQRVMTIPGLFRWVKKPEYRKQGKIRLRVHEAGPDAEGRSNGGDADGTNRIHDPDPWAGPEVGPWSGSLRTLEPNPYPIPNPIPNSSNRGDPRNAANPWGDTASNIFAAPVPFAASGGSENTGPEEPLQLGEESQAVLTPPLAEWVDERTSTVELTNEPESPISDGEVSVLDIALAELMFGDCDEYSVSYVREHRL
jgi:hypothetical protein